MQFNSYAYLALLLPAVGIFWALPPVWRRKWVFVLSLGFYAAWDPRFLVLPLVVGGIAWLCGSRIVARKTGQTRWVRGGIAACLVLLAWFKYRQFFWDNLGPVFGLPPLAGGLLSIGLPLGISFYTFNAIGLLIDASQRRIRSLPFRDVMLFATFWPQLLSGPIVRARELMPQLSFRKPFQEALFYRGLDRLIWGLVQKNVIANSLAGWLDEGFLPKAAAMNSGLDNWFLALGYGLQVYYDFAAYTNMALGTALLLGVELPENFRFPYHAKNPSDFWSRWHMSLSRWIRDYLFFPINARHKDRPLVLYASLVGVMALVGLWHGAGWGFVMWGFIHGVMLVLYRIWENLAATRSSLAESRLASGALRILTLAGAFVAWIPFRCHSLDQALTMLGRMAQPWAHGPSYPVNFYLLTTLVAVLSILEPYWISRADREGRSVAGNPSRKQLWGRAALGAAAIGLFMICDEHSLTFVYFQF